MSPNSVESRPAATSRAVRRISTVRVVLTMLAIVTICGAVVLGFGVLREPNDQPSESAGECPPLRPGTNNSATDYFDLVIWSGRTYVAADGRTTGVSLGTEVTTVRCSITELTAQNGNLVGPTPWPDRTATFLPSGAVVFAVAGVEPECQLAVPDQLAEPGMIKVYTAVDMEAEEMDPLC